jgi:hypothetical protein
VLDRVQRTGTDDIADNQLRQGGAVTRDPIRKVEAAVGEDLLLQPRIPKRGLQLVGRQLSLDALDASLGPLADQKILDRGQAPRLHEEAQTNVILSREFARGDAAGAMAAAHVRVGARFRFHRKAPLAIENRCYLAEYHQGRRELTLYGTTQVPGIIRECGENGVHAAIVISAGFKEFGEHGKDLERQIAQTIRIGIDVAHS